MTTSKPRYMDNHGFQRKDWKDSPKSIRRAERWVQTLLDRGATIPEAWWDVFCTFQVAFENLRYERVQAEAKTRKARRTKKARTP